MPIDQQQQQQQEEEEAGALGHRATLAKCLIVFDAAGRVTLRAHGHAVARVIALAEQVCSPSVPAPAAAHVVCTGEARAHSAPDQHVR
jgi:hypothetical protein